MNGALFRGLTRRDIVALTVNNIVGSGIFTMPAVLVAGAGNWSVAVLLIAVALVATMALCLVEVASRYDVNGGPMYYASAAFGPATGFVVGWLMYMSRLAAFGAIATIMLDYAAGLWPSLGTPVGRAAAITVFVGAITAINLRGIVHGAMTINVLTVIKGVPLVVLALAGLRFGQWASMPAAPADSAALGDAALVAFFTCMGFETAAVLAGEVRDPRRDLPLGILGGVLGAGALFILLLLTCLQTVPDLAQSTRPLADAAAALAGPLGATIVLVTGVTSCAGNLSGWMVVSPRVLYALAVQGDVPQALATVHPVSRVPRTAILVSAFLVWLATVSGTFVYLATFSAIARLLTYASTCAALIALRRSAGPAPVPIPLGPVVATIALLGSFFALASTTGTAVRDVLIALAVGWMLRDMTRRWSRTVAAPAQT